MVFRCISKVTNDLAGWLTERCTPGSYGTEQESGVADWRHTFSLLMTMPMFVQVRVASAMACHASDEARGIIRGASL